MSVRSVCSLSALRPSEQRQRLLVPRARAREVAAILEQVREREERASGRSRLSAMAFS